MGAAYYRLGRYSEAIEALASLEEADPDSDSRESDVKPSARAYRLASLALSSHELGDQVAAVEGLRTAWTLVDDDTDAELAQLSSWTSHAINGQVEAQREGSESGD
ncbi:MAG: hypothetical protein GY711_34710 [bacterium]|nr:hypothetical protein [bacterium]